MRNDTMSKILYNINESVVENEPTVGVEEPTVVFQCPDCKNFFTATDAIVGKDTVICPVCKSSIKPEEYGVVVPTAELSIEPEAEVVLESSIDEALALLESGDYDMFESKYGDVFEMDENGDLYAIAEAKVVKARTAVRNGKVVKIARRVKRKMTAKQKAAFKQIRKKGLKAAQKSGAKKKRAKSMKVARSRGLIKNESYAVKLMAMKVLESLGVSFNSVAFNEAMNEKLAAKFENYNLVEAIDDAEFELEEFDEMTAEQVAEVVTEILKDAGLVVLSNSAEITDAGAVTIDFRVQDSDEIEVRTGNIVDIIKAIFDDDIEVNVVGPTYAEEDATIADLTIIIGEDVVVESCSSVKGKKNECDDSDDTDDDKNESWVGGFEKSDIEDMKRDSKYKSIMTKFTVKKDPTDDYCVALFGSTSDLKKLIDLGKGNFGDYSEINEMSEKSNESLDIPARDKFMLGKYAGGVDNVKAVVKASEITEGMIVASVDKSQISIVEAVTAVDDELSCTANVIYATNESLYDYDGKEVVFESADSYYVLNSIPE